MSVLHRAHDIREFMTLDPIVPLSTAVFPIDISDQGPHETNLSWSSIVLIAVDATDRWSQNQIEIEIQCKQSVINKIPPLIGHCVLYVDGLSYSRGRIICTPATSTITVKLFSDIRSNHPGQDLHNLSPTNVVEEDLPLLKFLVCGKKRWDQICNDRVQVNCNAVGSIIKWDTARPTLGTDYKITLQAQDASLDSNEVVVVNMFQPPAVLPQIRRQNDIILIQNGRLQTFNNKVQVIIDKSANWMIFSICDDNEKPYQQSSASVDTILSDHHLFCIRHLRREYRKLNLPEGHRNHPPQQNEASENINDKSNTMNHTRSKEPLKISRTIHEPKRVELIKSVLNHHEDFYKFYCRLRVTGVEPTSLEQFCIQYCYRCQKSTDGFVTCLLCGPSGNVGWIWSFSLICQDATGEINLHCMQNDAVRLNSVQIVQHSANGWVLCIFLI
uniref:Telomeric single stranded DNA binding POT1/Cdc13 domain-containing protein n=1 Tax=Spongospora subterranea TaxID=70186 RepID=A0A0H5QQ29_9EUKA|eukprot:CRZ03541.1 hypothetical protein [Spongospora subterranea]